MTDAPTLADLQAAQAELDHQLDRQARYDGNNPNKHVTDVRLAREKVTALTAALKAAGLIPRTKQEILEARLDATHPRARHKDIVTFENERYQRWLEPATRSLSGGVMTWSKTWKRMAKADPKIEF
ncbi:hypothetical protein [Caulobacter soli]|uniref:hypothetical protein n=1 Tax=Caulobacter soli TaxID=2708539 RepID=UPI0013EDE64E|nr:hypothetical protein [Caulobacter soli]